MRDCSLERNFYMTPFLCLFCSFVWNSCSFLVIGAAGVAGGYAVSPDGIEGISEKSYDQIWQAARNVFEQQGSIELSDKEHGEMKAKIGGSTVNFKLEQATKHSVVARVQARKLSRMFPDMNLARRIYSMIMYESAESKEL